jgi:hypothetical protein
MEVEEKAGSRGFLLVFLILVAPVVGGAFVTAGWAWGWNHLHYAGPVWTAVLFLVGAALWIPAVSDMCDGAFDWIGARLNRDGVQGAVIFALIGIAAFAAFPIATRMYGDSKVIVEDHTPQHLAIYIHRMLSFGVLQRGSANFAFHDVLSRLTGLSFERTFMLVSALSGGVFLFAYVRLAQRLPTASGWARAVILWLGITDGANQMFFGHVESYVVPRLFEILFLIEVLRSLMMEPERPSRSTRARTILWFALAVLFHLQAIVLLPTLLMWIMRDAARAHPRLRPWVGRRIAGIGVAFGVIILAAAYLAVGSWCYNYIYSGGRPHPQQIFAPISTACAGLPYLRYTLFSASHLLDFFGGLWSVSSPAILLVIALFLPRAWRDERTFVLLPSIAAAILHDFFLNSAIGYPFDWDLMCVISPPLLFTAVFLLARAPLPSPRRGLIPALLFLGLGTATIFGVNASRARVYHRVEDMGVWLHKTYFGGSHYRLSANLSTITDPKEQIAERARVAERIAPDAYPDDREVAFLWEKLALKRIELEDYSGALDPYFRALQTEPSRWDRKKPVGYLESEVGDVNEGIRLLSDYVKKAPTDGEGWLFLGDACARQGLMEPARKSWKEFLVLTPDAPEASRVRDALRRSGGE